MQKLWFKAKTYGWGWTPSSWEGWSVLAVYLAVYAWLFMRFLATGEPTSDEVVSFVIKISVLTAVLIVICWKTGEKPRWRWGKDT